MANDSGLKPVTPHSSAHSCTAVPIKPRRRPSRRLLRLAQPRGSAPGTPGGGGPGDAMRPVPCPLVRCWLWPERLQPVPGALRCPGAAPAPAPCPRPAAPRAQGELPAARSSAPCSLLALP